MQHLHHSRAGPTRARYNKHTIPIILVAICIVIQGCGGLAPPGTKMEAALPGHLHTQKQVVWSFEAETKRCLSRWNLRA
jgi:hypothetical protein